MPASRPSRDVLYALVFGDEHAPRAQYRQRKPGMVEQARCGRKGHLMVVAVRSLEWGWWVTWLTAGGPWEYDWADQVHGYTEGVCTNCGRRRNVGQEIAKLMR